MRPNTRDRIAPKFDATVHWPRDYRETTKWLYLRLRSDPKSSWSRRVWGQRNLFARIVMPQSDMNACPVSLKRESIIGEATNSIRADIGRRKDTELTTEQDLPVVPIDKVSVARWSRLVIFHRRARAN